MTLLQLRQVLPQRIYRLHPAKLLKNVQSGISAYSGTFWRFCDGKEPSRTVDLRDTALHVAALFVAGVLLAELVAMPEDFTAFQQQL